MSEFTWKIAFLLALFGPVAFGVISTLPKSVPLFARTWTGLLAAVLFAFIAFVITGVAGALPVVAGWLR